MNKLDKVETQILTALQKVADDLYVQQAGATKWTKLMKRALQDVAYDNGFTPLPGEKEQKGGWLWDLCWVNGNPDERLDEVVLACEIEWWNYKTLSSLLRDFHKLTVGENHYCLFVFDTAKKLLTQAVEQVKLVSKRAKGKRYLAVHVPGKRNPNGLDHWSWTT